MERTYLDMVYNNVYYLNVWAFHHEDFKFLVDAVESKDVTAVVLLAAEEYHFNPFFHDLETFKVFKGFCNSHNTKLTVITGCNTSDRFGYKYNILNYRDNMISWETFFAHQTVERSLATKRMPLGYNNTINKHFISLNGRAHPHRCMFLDYMYKEDLFQHGYVSFHNFENLEYLYEFKHWNPTPLKFDMAFESSSDGMVDHMIPPIEFKDALFSVICESTVNVQFLTEKTYIPIWNRRPVLIYGHPKANLYLKSLGFELFDEVIDYSFDAIEDDEERCIEFMKQVKQLCSYNINDLRKQLMPKIHRNWLTLINILGNKKTRNRIERHLPADTNHEQVNGYRNMLNITDDIDYAPVLEKLKEQYENTINRK